MKHSRGLSFIEMLIASTVFLALGGALVAATLATQTSNVSSDAFVQVQEEARRAFDAMVAELHEAGNVNNNVSIAGSGVQRLDFQISRGYDATGCASTNGICWGSESAVGEWIHYVLDSTTDASNPRFMRCVTAGRLDDMPTGYAGCRVLTNRVNSTLANTAFTYDHTNRMVTVNLQTRMASDLLPGGSLAVAPTSLTTQVRLRNP